MTENSRFLFNALPIILVLHELVEVIKKILSAKLNSYFYSIPEFILSIYIHQVTDKIDAMIYKIRRLFFAILIRLLRYWNSMADCTEGSLNKNLLQFSNFSL